MKKLDIGAALSGALDLYGKNWQLLITLSLLIYGVLGVVVAVVVGLFFVNLAVAALSALVLAVLAIVASYLVQGMTIIAINDLMAGAKNLAIGDLFQRASPRFGALVGTSLLAGLGILGGMILLVVPGIWLMVMWAFAAPVVMLENRSGGSALGRSKELISGNGWQMFGLIILVGIITNIATRVLGGIVSSLSPSDMLDVFLAFVVPGAIVGPFGALVTLQAYGQLTGGSAGGGEGTAVAPTTPAPQMATPVAPAPVSPVQPAQPAPAQPNQPSEGDQLPPSPLS